MPPVTITIKAAHWIKELINTRGNCLGVRFGTLPAGCGGYKYSVDYVHQVVSSDLVFEQHGVKFFIDSDHMSLLQGMQVVFRTEGLDRKLEFVNPNAAAICGCGDSFST